MLQIGCAVKSSKQRVICKVVQDKELAADLRTIGEKAPEYIVLQDAEMICNICASCKPQKETKRKSTNKEQFQDGFSVPT